MGDRGDFLVPGSYPSLFYIIYFKSPKRGPNLLIIKYLCCMFAKVYPIDFDSDGLNTWQRALLLNLDMCKHIIKMAIAYAIFTGFTCLKMRIHAKMK